MLARLPYAYSQTSRKKWNNCNKYFRSWWGAQLKYLQAHYLDVINYKLLNLLLLVWFVDVRGFVGLFVFCGCFVFNSNLSSLSTVIFWYEVSGMCSFNQRICVTRKLNCGTGSFLYFLPGHVAYSFHARLNYCCGVTFMWKWLMKCLVWFWNLFLMKIM